MMGKHRGAKLEMTARACMTKSPQTIGPHVLASEALNLMEKRKITSIVVTDEAKGVLGVVHLLHQFQCPQIMQVHHAQHALRLIRNHYGGNLALLHQV